MSDPIGALASARPYLDPINIAALATAALTTLAGLAAVSLAHTDVQSVIALCSPVVSSCLLIFKAR